MAIGRGVRENYFMFGLFVKIWCELCKNHIVITPPLYRLLHNDSSSTDVANESTVTEPQLNSFQALAQNVEQDTSSHFLVPPEPTASIGGVHSSPSLNEQTPLLFSHLEHTHSTYDDKSTNANRSPCYNCGHWTDASSLHYEGSTCPSCGESLTVTNSNTDEDIITSFNSLSVSPASEISLASSALRTGSHMSCRQQAVTYRPSYFDDTTVDDLAGYLDEIMFLPKPMSEMAELMYT